MGDISEVQAAKKWIYDSLGFSNSEREAKTMSVKVHVSGFKFAALKKAMRENIASELNSGADSMVSLAKQLAPVDTGYMRDHISQTEEASSENLKSVVESEADYSAFVEYGTVHQDAQPFFTPAFENARRQVNNGLKRVLQRVV